MAHQQHHHHHNPGRRLPLSCPLALSAVCSAASPVSQYNGNLAAHIAMSDGGQAPPAQEVGVGVLRPRLAELRPVAMQMTHYSIMRSV
jgi:hypothetical protein